MVVFQEIFRTLEMWRLAETLTGSTTGGLERNGNKTVLQKTRISRNGALLSGEVYSQTQERLWWGVFLFSKKHVSFFSASL